MQVLLFLKIFAIGNGENNSFLLFCGVSYVMMASGMGM